LAQRGGVSAGGAGGASDATLRRVGFSLAVCYSEWHIGGISAGGAGGASDATLRRVGFSLAVCYSEWYIPPFLACCHTAARRILLRDVPPATSGTSPPFSDVLLHCGASDSPSRCAAASGILLRDVPQPVAHPPPFLTCCYIAARRILLRDVPPATSGTSSPFSDVLVHCGASDSPSRCAACNEWHIPPLF